MVLRSHGLLVLTVLGVSLLAACSLDVQGHHDGRLADPGQTSTADVIPVENPTAVDDGGSATDAVVTPDVVRPDAAAPATPVTPKPGVACGGAQCAASDICCINFGSTSSQVCQTGDGCDGARLACDEPSDCPGAVCCMSNATFGGDPPRTKCDSKCDGAKDSQVCDPAVGCSTGTCTQHPLIGIYYCR